MTTQEALDTLERIDDLFGEISNSLVYVCEELPSLGVSREIEHGIVTHCCVLLEKLVDIDKNFRQISRSLRGNVDHVLRGESHLPESIRTIVASAAKEVSTAVQSMHGLSSEFQSRAAHDASLHQLNVVLKDSGETLRTSLDRLREEFSALLTGTAHSDSPA